MTGATRWRSGAAPGLPRLVSDGGAVIELPVGRWRCGPDPAERALLETLGDPVLDVGCGPGRIVGALAAGGRPALGVDPSGTAIAEAHRRRAPALRRSVFDRLPGEGRWATVLLLDGNIGIGGDPGRLLRRVAALLAPGGEVVVEVDPPGHSSQRLTVRVESPAGSVGPWFPWARVGADRFPPIAARAGLRTTALGALTGARNRWIARAVVGDR
jgi:SAM-dependent methyltransferase